MEALGFVKTTLKISVKKIHSLTPMAYALQVI